jgi:crossover junction endonuclease MUS81
MNNRSELLQRSGSEMAAVCLVIDNRERELIPLLSNVPHTTENLELGDVVFKAEDGSIISLFERKTWSDLGASIKDGRYHNQKKRLLESYPVHKLGYIIEGPGDFTDTEDVLINGISKKTMLSCVYNTTLRDGIRVFRTQSIGDTVSLITGMMSRLVDDPGVFGGGGEAPEQIVKHTVRTPSEFFLRALCQVPGVSKKTASTLVERYSTIYKFMGEFSGSNETEKLKALKEITTRDAKGKSKRISGTVAQSLLEFIVGGTDNVVSPLQQS